MGQLIKLEKYLNSVHKLVEGNNFILLVKLTVGADDGGVGGRVVRHGEVVGRGSGTDAGTNCAINQKQRTAFNTLDARFPRQFAHELNIKASRLGTAIHPLRCGLLAAHSTPLFPPPPLRFCMKFAGFLPDFPGKWANKIKVGNTRK